MEMEVRPLNIIHGDPSAKFLCPVPMNLHSAGLEVLVPKGGMNPPEDKIMMLRLLAGHLWLLITLSQKSKRGITGL